METIRSELSSLRIHYDELSPEVKDLITEAEQQYQKLPENKRKIFFEKLIAILAKADGDRGALRTEIGRNKYKNDISNIANSLKANVETELAMSLRTAMCKQMDLKPNPSDNNKIDQFMLAFVDEIVISSADLLVVIVDEIGRKGAIDFISGIIKSIFSLDLWKQIGKDGLIGLRDFLFDWSTPGNDLFYKKVRTAIIIGGFGIVIRSALKKFAEKATLQSAKKSTALIH